jgi:hypothetical protein
MSVEQKWSGYEGAVQYCMQGKVAIRALWVADLVRVIIAEWMMWLEAEMSWL